MNMKEQNNDKEESVLIAIVKLSKLALELSKLYEKFALIERTHAKDTIDVLNQIQETMDIMDTILIEDVLGEDLSPDRD